MTDSIVFAVVLILLCTGMLHAEEMLPVIPVPVKTDLQEGRFTITTGTAIVVEEATEEAGNYLSDLLASAVGLRLEVKRASKENARSHCIFLQIMRGMVTFGDEGYILHVTKERASIHAAGPAGIFYGIQTLRQLLPEIPCVSIMDKPRFEWRGLMIDCSRTFWSKEFIVRTIRLMALYKMNRLHLHLTDDQGWRLEIRKHPRLTAEGARFAEKYGEQPEGFYTREEMKEIIACGLKHHVTIVPEIEMPGHSIAALSVYPELSCTGGPFEIYPFFKGPGITQDIYCAGKEETFEFLEEVLTEVIELFPSEFIHIGGDEAPKTRWQKCELCQARMKKEGLKNEHELQSYFIKRVEKFLNARGKRLIGWDEILEGGLAPNAAVMSWRGTRGGIAAAKAGHDVVMSPTSHCYFDYNHETTSIEKAYGFEPVPENVQANRILGAQANFWSHIDRTEEGVDRQVFPRLLCIAEATWSPREARGYDHFVKRLKAHGTLLERLGVKFFRDPSIWAVEEERETPGR